MSSTPSQLDTAVSHVPGASPFLPVEEYLTTSYHPDCDYVDGVLEERNAGESEHSFLQIALGSWFFTHRAEWNLDVFTEQRNRISPRRYRIPDVCVTTHTFPRERIRTTPPIICIEILSPEDRVNRIIQRLDDFLQMGVANLWILDPLKRQAYTYDADGLHTVHTARLSVPNSPIYVDLNELFALLDEDRT